MKREDLKNTINSIEPDLYMSARLKNKIKSRTSSRKPRTVWVSLTAAALTVAFVFGIGFLSNSSFEPATLPTTKNEAIQNNSSMKGFILIASASEGDALQQEITPKTLELNESYPYKYYLSVEDVRGKSETERKAVFEKMKAENEKICSQNSVSESCASICGGGDNTIINHLMMNSFKLDVENVDNIENICITNESDYGYMEYDKNVNGVMTFDGTTYSSWEKGKNLVISADEYLKNDGELRIHWRHSAEMDQAIDENPEILLSTFKDTITFTVNYKDGTSAVGVVDIAFSNDGNMTVVCRDYIVK